MKISAIKIVSFICAFAIVLCLSVHPVSAQAEKRGRGEGLYQCASANVPGTRDIWASLMGVGYIWDNTISGQDALPIIGANIEGEIGILNSASLLIGSRALEYNSNFGNVYGGFKLTIPNNKDLRINGIGLEARYIHNVADNIRKSIAGFRSGGTGFFPEGFQVQGGNIQLKLLYDLDLISKISWLPLKLMFNAGIRVPLDLTYTPYSQYLVDAGLAYIGLTTDIFVEYSIEAFVNGSTEPKLFEFIGRRWEVAFTENPMFLTVGGRLRYSSGVTLNACVPICLSQNVGSSMSTVDKQRFFPPDPKYFADEHRRGITDPFDPWYAKWKVVGWISFPLRFKLTGAEMMRNFLLLKNRSGGNKIDINERLQLFEETGTNSTISSEEKKKQEQKEKQDRLEKIRKEREQMEKGE